MDQLGVDKACLLARLDEIVRTNKYPRGAERCIAGETEYNYASEPLFKAEGYREWIAGKEGARLGLADALPKLKSGEGVRVFVACLLVAEQLGEAERKTFREKGLRVAKQLTIPGDLEVDGKLEIVGDYEGQVFLHVLGDLHLSGDLMVEDGTHLRVLGNVMIEGSYLDSSEWSHVVVCGDLRVRDGFVSSGDCYVGGDLSAPFAYVSYNHGHLAVLGGVRSQLFLENDHLGSRVYTPANNEIEIADVDELLGIDPDSFEEDFLPKLKTMLVPLEGVELDGEMDMFEFRDQLLEAVKAGDPIFAGSGVGPLYDANR